MKPPAFDDLVELSGRVYKPSHHPSKSRHVPCPACGARANASCVGPTGRRTRPHAERVAAAEGRV